MATASYLDLVTSEHADKPKFLAVLQATCQPFADIQEVQLRYPGLYDVDVAVGQQLDVCGQWVGVSRQLDTAISGVYFAFDTADVGFDQGVWISPYDPISGLVALPDDYYRAVIKMRILNNHWDGSKDSAYALMNTVFGVLGYGVYIEDPADLTMKVGIVGPTPPTALLKALIQSGKFNIKPAGVHITAYYTQSAAGPIFGFDINNTLIGGFDVGNWGVSVVS